MVNTFTFYIYILFFNYIYYFYINKSEVIEGKFDDGNGKLSFY